MTTNRLQFCLVTALTLGAVQAQAQVATPVAPAQQGTPAPEQVAPPGYPAGQPYPAPNGGPGQYPAGQPYPGQPYPAQPPYSGPPYSGQPYPGQPYPGQAYPAPPYSGQPYPPPPYPGQPYPGQPYPAAPALNTTVHIDTSDREATLFQHTGSSAFVGYAYRGAVVGTMDFWQRICRAPCDQPVDTNATYSIRGNGIVPSAPFSFAAGQSKVNVNAGHTGPRIGGWFLTLLGGATFVSGLALVGMGALFKTFDSANDSALPPSSSSDKSLSSSGGSYMAAGGVTMAIGAGALAGGIVLLVKSRTQVQINGEASAQLQLPGGRSLYVNAHGLAF